MISGFVFGQRGAEEDSLKGSSTIIIDNADHTKFKRSEGYFLYGNVQMRQDSIYFRADTALKNDNNFIAWKDVSIQQGDSLSVFADSLYYSGDSLIAYLHKNVSLVDRERTLFTKYLIYNLDQKVAGYSDGGLLTDQNAQLFSKVGRYNVRRNLMFFEDSVRVTHPDFLLKADSLAYNMQSDSVLFRGPTLMTFDSTRIYCERGYYDIKSQHGSLNKNAQYQRADAKASGQKIEYFGKTERTYIIGNAFYEDDLRYAEADTILYDGKLNTTWLIGNAFFKDENSTADGAIIIFRNGTGEVFTEGRSTISLDNQLLTADSTYLSQDQKNGYATGGVVWSDTVNGTHLLAPTLVYQKDEQSVRTENGRPLFIFSNEGDTLYMSADTILSYTVIDTSYRDTLIRRDSLEMLNASSTDSVRSEAEELPDSVDRVMPATDSFRLDSIARVDTFRIMKAYYNVRIWSSEMSGICDSLVYLEKDSSFYLFRDPVLWTDSTQVTGDTITLRMGQEGIDRMRAGQNALMVDWVAGAYFNQIKSRTLFAFFREGRVDRISAEGNAQSLYFLQDDEDALIGLQESTCSRIEAVFDTSSNLEKILFIQGVDGKILPVKGLDPLSKRFEGFRWMWEQKPKSREELYFDPSLNAYTDLKKVSTVRSSAKAIKKAGTM